MDYKRSRRRHGRRTTELKATRDLSKKKTISDSHPQPATTDLSVPTPYGESWMKVEASGPGLDDSSFSIIHDQRLQGELDLFEPSIVRVKIWKELGDYGLGEPQLKGPGVSGSQEELKMFQLWDPYVSVWWDSRADWQGQEFQIQKLRDLRMEQEVALFSSPTTRVNMRSEAHDSHQDFNQDDLDIFQLQELHDNRLRSEEELFWLPTSLPSINVKGVKQGGYGEEQRDKHEWQGTEDLRLLGELELFGPPIPRVNLRNEDNEESQLQQLEYLKIRGGLGLFSPTNPRVEMPPRAPHHEEFESRIPQGELGLEEEDEKATEFEEPQQQILSQANLESFSALRALKDNLFSDVHENRESSVSNLRSLDTRFMTKGTMISGKEEMDCGGRGVNENERSGGENTSENAGKCEDIEDNRLTGISNRGAVYEKDKVNVEAMLDRGGSISEVVAIGDGAAGEQTKINNIFEFYQEELLPNEVEINEMERAMGRVRVTIDVKPNQMIASTGYKEDGQAEVNQEVIINQVGNPRGVQVIEGIAQEAEAGGGRAEAGLGHEESAMFNPYLQEISGVPQQRHHEEVERSGPEVASSSTLQQNPPVRSTWLVEQMYQHYHFLYSQYYFQQQTTGTWASVGQAYPLQYQQQQWLDRFVWVRDITRPFPDPTVSLSSISPILYRVYDNCSVSQFHSAGFTSGSPYMPCTALEFRSMVELHANWRNRAGTPFISLTSTPRGVDWQVAIRRDRNRGKITVALIDTAALLVTNQSTLWEMHNAMDHYGVPPPGRCQRSTFNDEYLCALHIPLNSIIVCCDPDNYRANALRFLGKLEAQQYPQ